MDYKAILYKNSYFENETGRIINLSIPPENKLHSLLDCFDHYVPILHCVMM